MVKLPVEQAQGEEENQPQYPRREKEGYLLGMELMSIILHKFLRENNDKISKFLAIH